MSTSDSKAVNESMTARVVVVLLMTIMPIVFLDYLFQSFGIAPSIIKGVGLLLAAGCFLAGSGALVFTGASKRKALMWMMGVVAGLGAFAVSGVNVALGLPAGDIMGLLIVGGVLVAGAFLAQEVQFRSGGTPRPGVTATDSGLALSMKRVLSPDLFVRAVEVIGMPESYLGISEDEKIARKGHLPFYNVVRTLTLSEVPCAVRLERFSGRTRIFYLTSSKDVKGADRCQASLVDTLKANLPEFDVKVLTDLPLSGVTSQMRGITATLVGEPLSIEDQHQRDDPLTAVVDILRHNDSAILQISSTPYRPSGSELRSLERQYEEQMQSSQQTVSTVRKSLFASDSQSSTMLVDAKALREAEETKRQIERYSNRYLCRVSVAAACWDKDEDYAKKSVSRLLQSLMGSVAPASKEKDFRLKVKKSASDLQAILRGEPVGERVTLTPQEATVYFVLPRSDVGIRVIRRDAFAMGSATVGAPVRIEKPEESPCPGGTLAPIVAANARSMKASVPEQGSFAEWKLPAVSGIFLGYALGKDGESLSDRPVYVRIEDLDSHFGIFGSTRSGKTTVAISMVAQMIRSGVKPFVIVPWKVREWVRVLEIDAQARIFIAGSSGSLRVTYNLFDPPPGVPLSRWIQVVTAILTASLPSDRVIAMHIDDVVHTSYQRCGWNIREGTRGRPVLLSDLYESVKEVYGRLGYGSEIKSNVYGALLARIRAMLRNPAVVRMFNTDKGITIPELLENTTIISMEGLGEDDKILLTALLTAAIAEYRLANPVKGVRNVLVIEEAHFLLARHPDLVDGMPTAQGKAVKNIVNMLRTSGGVGLGIALLDQLPGSLDSDALRLIVNSIVFRLGDPEHEVAGRHARCTESQREHITGMKRGEAIVFLEREGVPLNVQITPLDSLVTIVGTVEERQKRLTRRIMGVLKAHPNWGASLPLPEHIIRDLEGSEPIAGPELKTLEQSPEAGIRVLTQEQEDGLRLEIAKESFLDFLNPRLPAARDGDYGPLTIFLKGFGEKFCPPGTDKDYFVRRVVVIAQEIHGAPELEEVARRLNPTHAEVADAAEESGS